MPSSDAQKTLDDELKEYNISNDVLTLDGFEFLDLDRKKQSFFCRTCLINRHFAEAKTKTIFIIESEHCQECRDFRSQKAADRKEVQVSEFSECEFVGTSFFVDGLEFMDPKKTGKTYFCVQCTPKQFTLATKKTVIRDEHQHCQKCLGTSGNVEKLPELDGNQSFFDFDSNASTSAIDNDSDDSNNFDEEQGVVLSDVNNRKRKHSRIIPLPENAIQISRQLWTKKVSDKSSIVHVKDPENMQFAWEFVAYSENTDFYECLSCKKKVVRFFKDDFYIVVEHTCSAVPLIVLEQKWRDQLNGVTISADKSSIVHVKDPENMQFAWEFVAYSENTDFYECLSCKKKVVRFFKDDFYIVVEHTCSAVPLVVLEEKWRDQLNGVAISAGWWRSKEKQHNFTRTKQFSYFSPQIFIDFQKKMSSLL
uniref:Uncharacterized protein n=1 Tax=Panagrolaimus sp. JU765 TaxID=591449 RepID=A0AC34RKF6_9BILA